MKHLSQVSWGRVLTRSGLLLLAFYLAFAGGKYSGRILYPLVWINTWLIVLGGLGWMVWRFLRRRPFPSTPLDWPLLLWVIVCLFSALSSIDPRVSLERWGYELVCVLVFYMMVDLERAGKRVEIWLQMTIAAGGIFLVFGFMELLEWYRQWLSIGGWEQPIPPATVRIRAAMAHANILAAYLNCLWPLAAVRLLASPRKWLRWILGVYTGLCLALLYFTSSRGGWLSALAATITLGILLAVDRREKITRAWQQLRVTGSKLVAGVILIVALVGVAGGLFLRQSQHPTHPPGNPRFYIWHVAIEMFAQRPWLGTGPGTFPRYFMQSFSIPPGFLLSHAHQYFLDVLGESGFLSLLILLGLGMVVAWSGWRRWRTGKKGERSMLAGALAALVGLAVHSQFDVPQDTFLINHLTAALLVSLMPPSNNQSGNTRKKLCWQGVLLLAGWGIAAGWGIYMLRGWSHYQTAMDAAQVGRWSLAQEELTEAVEKDPGLSFYRFQKGIAEAGLAIDAQGAVVNSSLLEAAIQDVQQMVYAQPEFALGWANLAVLQWWAGDRREAFASLDEAVKRAPGSAGLQLLVGSLYEAQGEIDEAQKAYRQALLLQPSLSFWEVLPASPMWNQIVESESQRFPYEGEGWRMIEAGDAAGAVEYFQKTIGLNDAQGYFGLGIAFMRLGQWTKAEKALQTALFIGPPSVEMYKALGKVYEAEGKFSQASGCDEKALAFITTWLSFGYDDFSQGYFQRENLPVPYLPIETLWQELGKDR